MTKTIARLWNGELDPIQHFGMNNSEIKQLEIFIQRNRENLEEVLSEKEKAILEKYNDCINEYILAISEQAFCDGFCLGARITAEALIGAEQIL